VRRLPIRVRVAAAFAVAMAIVLTATGMLLYARLGDDLAAALDNDLRLHAQDVSALVADPRSSLATPLPEHLIERGESFSQLLDLRGNVLSSTTTLGSKPLLTVSEITAAAKRAGFLDRPSVPGLDEPARLLAVPVDRGGRRLVLVVGATRENRAEALSSLREQLLILGPMALALATIIGYLLAGSGLRAVEAMRRRAADISADRKGERLPVPGTHDELQRLGETLNAMLGRLESALQRERAFVAEAGHELRTPLALLRAELDYALRYADTADELRDALRAASQETDRLVQLAGDLLLIASGDLGHLALCLERLNATEVLESVRQRFAWRAEAEGRSVVLSDRAKMVVVGDRLRLEQALGNLVENALRHGAGQVTLAASAAASAVELLVRDQGSGFPPEFLAHAFERFTRGDPSHSGEGAGLGLTIVQAIAQAHGGRATAGNRSAGGAEVTIHLPFPSSKSSPDVLAAIPSPR
jgi:two-component system, OmpR family, sensor kinase